MTYVGSITDSALRLGSQNGTSWSRICRRSSPGREPTIIGRRTPSERMSESVATRSSADEALPRRSGRGRSGPHRGPRAPQRSRRLRRSRGLRGTGPQSSGVDLRLHRVSSRSHSASSPGSRGPTLWFSSSPSPLLLSGISDSIHTMTTSGLVGYSGPVRGLRAMVGSARAHVPRAGSHVRGGLPPHFHRENRHLFMAAARGSGGSRRDPGLRAPVELRSWGTFRNRSARQLFREAVGRAARSSSSGLRDHLLSRDAPPPEPPREGDASRERARNRGRAPLRGRHVVALRRELLQRPRSQDPELSHSFERASLCTWCAPTAARSRRSRRCRSSSRASRGREQELRWKEERFNQLTRSIKEVFWIVEPEARGCTT